MLILTRASGVLAGCCVIRSCRCPAVIAQCPGTCVAGGVVDEAMHECVGHDLAFASFVTGGFGTGSDAGERGEDTHALLEGNQRGQKGHAVRGWP